MKIPDEWLKCMQEHPQQSESCVNSNAYSRYSEDIPDEKMRLNPESKEYREYHISHKISPEINLLDNII